jgi:hypothetical protein
MVEEGRLFSIRPRATRRGPPVLDPTKGGGSNDVFLDCHYFTVVHCMCVGWLVGWLEESI